VENCTKFGQLILGKIIKFVATSCEILRLKCTKFDFGWDFAPVPVGRAYSAPPDPLGGFQGPTYNGRRGKGKKRVVRRGKRERGRKGEKGGR